MTYFSGAVRTTERRGSQRWLNTMYATFSIRMDIKPRDRDLRKIRSDRWEIALLECVERLSLESLVKSYCWLKRTWSIHAWAGSNVSCWPIETTLAQSILHDFFESGIGRSKAPREAADICSKAFCRAFLRRVHLLLEIGVLCEILVSGQNSGNNRMQCRYYKTLENNDLNGINR